MIQGGLTEADYLAELQALLPPGGLTRDPDAVLTKLLSVFAASLARVDALATALLEEADPRTTVQLLPDWERVLGLPDKCAGGESLTLQERRAWLVGRMTARGGQSRAWFISLAASLGYAIAIDEFRPFTCGLSVCGEQLAPEATWTVWRVRMPATPIYWFRAGASVCGERLGSQAAGWIECLFRRLKPAHTTVLFTYP